MSQTGAAGAGIIAACSLRDEGKRVKVYIELVPLLSVVAGILVLVAPKFLRYVVGAYLIAIGVLGMVH